MNELNLRNGNICVLRQAGLKVSGRKKAVCPKKEDRPPFHQKPATACAIKQNHMRHRYASEMSGNCFSNILLKIPNRFAFLKCKV